jgi:hypothetical protein
MNDMKFDLTIRIDELGQRFLFFATKRTVQVGASEPDFNVEISLEELNSKGADGAEKLVGESVLGFFDHLTDGRLKLPKHYREVDKGSASQ